MTNQDLKERHLVIAHELGYLWGEPSEHTPNHALNDFVRKTNLVLRLIHCRLEATPLDVFGVEIGETTLVKTTEWVFSSSLKETKSFVDFWPALAQVIADNLFQTFLVCVPRYKAIKKQGGNALNNLDLAAYHSFLDGAFHDCFDFKSSQETLTITAKPDPSYGFRLAIKSNSASGIAFDTSLYEGTRKVLVNYATSLIASLRTNYEAILAFNWVEWHYINNPCLGLVYVDPQAAYSLGCEDGWYITRAAKFHRGPFETPAQAAAWVKEEWGEEIGHYGNVAAIIDRYMELVRAYEAELLRIKPLPEGKLKKAQQDSAREHFDFLARQIADPYVKKEETLTTNSKRFLIPGSHGEKFIIRVWQAKKTSQALSWEITCTTKTGVHLNIGAGAGDGRGDEGIYVKLVYLLKGLIAKGDVEPKAIP